MILLSDVLLFLIFIPHYKFNITILAVLLLSVFPWTMNYELVVSL
jgi:hypothetical protein